MTTTYPDDKAVDKSLAKVTTLDEKASDSDVHSNHTLEGSEGVTEHELATLRHVSDKIPYTSFLVAVAEFSERSVIYHLSSLWSILILDFRWTYYGTTNIYNNYIRFPMPPGSTTGAVLSQNRAEGVAGALGLGVQKSFAIRTVRASSTSCLFPSHISFSSILFGYTAHPGSVESLPIPCGDVTRPFWFSPWFACALPSSQTSTVMLNDSHL